MRMGVGLREVGKNLKRQGGVGGKIRGLHNYRMKDVHIKTGKLSALLNYTSMEIAIHEFISFQQKFRVIILIALFVAKSNNKIRGQFEYDMN